MAQEWEASREGQGMPHVVPLNDWIEHVTDDPERCICQPTIKDGVCIDHSLDGREYSEPDYNGPEMPRE